MKLEIIIEDYNVKKVMSALKSINVTCKPKLKLINNMVHIKPGSFMMGSPESEGGRDDDESLHKVTITKDFYIGAYPVTQEEWESMGYNPVKCELLHTFKINLNVLNDHNAKFIGNSFFQEFNTFSKFVGLKKPVVYITFNEANEYCKRLTEQEQEKGNLPRNWHYCLPTEAQWEYACRAGSQGKYYNGYTNLNDIAWHHNNSNTRKKPNNAWDYAIYNVGQKKPNAWGLYDMLGNIWEWCSDSYDKCSDSFVIRGGYTGLGVTQTCRCAQRSFVDRNTINCYLGMRLVCCEI